MALVLNSKTVTGADVLSEGRSLLRQYKAQGLRVPRITVEGPWVMNGFDFDFDEPQEAYLPFGNKYVAAGPKRAKVEPTEDSVLTIYTVAEGESLNGNSTLAKTDLLADSEDTEDSDDDDEPEDDE